MCKVGSNKVEQRGNKFVQNTIYIGFFFKLEEYCRWADMDYCQTMFEFEIFLKKNQQQKSQIISRISKVEQQQVKIKSQ